MRLRKTIRANYQGHILQGFAKSLLTREEVRELYKKLERVPVKISAFIERSSVKEVYKYTAFTYFVIDDCNEVFVIDY